ncbi:MAG: DUF1565 domain-containing protein, partial [Candidatus Stygibacter australis]|nr:DUF1565 domain-containing protein [Candidatus Stygibacter australis]
ENVTITDNSAGEFGGGIFCADSSPSLENVTITGNSAGRNGGGIYCEESSPILEDVTITNNSAEWNCGGIYCSSSSPSLVNVTITNNTTDGDGGGIQCVENSSPSLENVTITGNSADERGGGIYCSFSSPSLENVTIMNNSSVWHGGGIYNHSSSTVFSSENRCNIYLNNGGYGNDIYSNTNMNVIVDTFTVLNPTDFHATPIENFTFDILHGLQGQINADLYVSPSGNNTNTGLTLDDPLKTIQYACSVILANSQNLHTIHLAEGTYSPSINGEIFPVNIPDFVSLCGESETGVILNAEGISGVIRLNNVENAISNLTITNGNTHYGGGILCDSSLPILENLMITGNSAERDGGGIYCDINSSPILENVTIADNSAERDGGGIYCQESSPILESVTIADNSAERDGGGIYCEDSSPILVNCIMWNNAPQEVYFNDDDDPNLITVAYTDIEDGLEGIVTNNNGTVNWLEGIIDSDPLFFDIEMGDYHLTEDSPCIDAGIAYFEYEGEVLVDLSEDEYWGIAPDMGAYEYGLVNTDEFIIQNSKLNIQNYPNPFNPETNIVFELSFGSNVLIEIYNIKGQKVTTLVNGPFEAGSHKITWNAVGQSSGVYLLRFNTTETSEMKKLILLK